MADNEKHLFANDGSDWTTPPSPVNAAEAREADKELEEHAKKGQGPAFANETKLSHSVVDDSQSKNG